MEENIHENVVAFLLDGGLIEYYQFNGFTFRDMDMESLSLILLIDAQIKMGCSRMEN